MQEERKKILKMVEDGIISSEEAEEIFDSLDKAEQAKYQQVSQHVDWDQAESNSNYYQKQAKSGTTAKKLLGFIEEAFSKIKNVDLDFNFGTHTKVSHIFQSQQPEIEKVDVDISNGNLQIVPWDERDVRIECEAKVYQESKLDEARKRFLSDVEFHLDNGILRFYIPSKQLKTDVVIRIPELLYDKVTIKLFNGSIDVENLQVKQFRSKTTNGAITLQGISGETYMVETANGSIKVEQAVLKELEAETINGSIHLNGEFDHVDAQAVSGSIHTMWNGIEAKSGFFKTTTGSIRLHLPQRLKVDGKLATNIGSIHCNFSDYKVIEKKSEMMRNLLHFEANSEIEQLLHLEAETKTGSIWMLPNE
ncbi:DUF4097 family beta strand repeat-containing protein [Aquibacillus kalidii]|uniref:DUF4097 family beta strand repeat-containing protein n=1 Tax=Aquibacillus kalidii TaxID=2762597 RepID=UPI001648C230|nr:DUF4097 domain-containing protein [Aquibacillus kalidii]